MNRGTAGGCWARVPLIPVLEGLLGVLDFRKSPRKERIDLFLGTHCLMSVAFTLCTFLLERWPPKARAGVEKEVIRPC